MKVFRRSVSRAFPVLGILALAAACSGPLEPGPGIAAAPRYATAATLTMYTPPAGNPMYGVLSPRTVQLKNSGGNNGKMYTTFEATSNSTPTFPVFESTDNGRTWAKVGDVNDTQHGLGMLACPQLFEMPQTIGSLTTGTLICVGLSSLRSYADMYMDMYKSTDLGRTWTFVSRVTESHGSSDPIWEPWLLVANNKLICYISDERDPNHSQKLVHYTTTNGTTWSSLVEDVVWPDTTTRPGMPVVSKLANGNYIMTFEVVGLSGTPCMYKINTNPETGWNAVTSTTFAYSGSPYNTVLSDGRIVANSFGSADILVNTANDGSGSWVSMGTPIGGSYNREILQLSNGRLFIVNGGDFNHYNSITYQDMYVPSTSGSYRLINVNSGKALAIGGGVTTLGQQAIQWTWDSTSPEKWQLVTVGSYKQLFNCKTGRLLGVSQGSTADGAAVIQWNDTGTNDQQWSLVASGSNYKIINRNSGKALGVYAGSTSDGANIVQWTDNGSTNQLWQLVAN